MKALRIAAIQLECQDAKAEVDFLRSVFGFRSHAESPLLLRLGEQSVEVVDAATRPVDPAPANSTAFQHFAIVVSDMDRAIAALDRRAGWTAISRDGPQRLPAASGGVVAFKFRDPEGHPLELLQFPSGAIPRQRRRNGGPFLGIDHSAIVVTDTARSVEFYRELGFAVAGQQLNRGIEQEMLDDVSDAVVEVTNLALLGGLPPHLELLCYSQRTRPKVELEPTRPAMRLVLVVDPHKTGSPNGRAIEKQIDDPDGHRLTLRENYGA